MERYLWMIYYSTYIEVVNVTVTVTIVIVVKLGSGEAQNVKRSLDGYILAQKGAA
jgi:hypothetical protein